MKKLIYLPMITLMITAVSCSMRGSNVKQTSAAQPATEKELFAVLQSSDTIKTGGPVSLKFTVYNRTDSVKKFLKWQTPFEPLLSKYLDIKNEQGEEAAYKGPMAKRMMPPPAEAYISLNPGDSLVANIDVLKAYVLTGPGKYTVTYNSEGVSGLKVRGQHTFIYK